jgi:hypothetical protein
MNAKLRLGPIPKAEVVRVTIAMPVTLKANLDRYAAVHAQTWGTTADVATIIPHMLEAFIARDRGFKRASVVLSNAQDQDP